MQSHTYTCTHVRTHTHQRPNFHLDIAHRIIVPTKCIVRYTLGTVFSMCMCVLNLTYQHRKWQHSVSIHVLMSCQQQNQQQQQQNRVLKGNEWYALLFKQINTSQYIFSVHNTTIYIACKRSGKNCKRSETQCMRAQERMRWKWYTIRQSHTPYMKRQIYF